MTTTEEPPDTFSFDYILACENPKRLRQDATLQSTLKGLHELASSEGLSAENIDALMKVICQNKFEEVVNSKLVRCLIPRRSIHATTALCPVSSICANKFSLNFQALIFRWLILVYDYIEEKEKFHSIYSILFNYLDYETLCRHVCQLIFIMTRHGDVKKYRVDIMMELHRKIGPQPYVLGVLTMFHLYRSDLLHIRTTSNKKFFRNSDGAWRKLIQNVQAKSQEEDEDEIVPAATETKSKKVKSRVPAIQPRLVSSKSSTQMSMAFVQNLNDILTNIHCLELPSQLASVIRNKSLLSIIAIHPDPSIPLRLNLWLDDALYEEFFNSPKVDTTSCMTLLNNVLDLMQGLNESIPVCDYFLGHYLQSWDGLFCRFELLQLITKCRLRPFTEFHGMVLEPLRKLFFASSLYFKCQCILALTTLLKNLVFVEYPRYRRHHEWYENLPEVASSNSMARPSVFPYHPDDTFDVAASLQFLIKFVGRLCTVALQVEEGHCLLTHCVMDFYQLVASIFCNSDLLVVELCSPRVIYQSLFALNPLQLSRVCQLINCYKNTLQKVSETNKKELSSVDVRRRAAALRLMGETNCLILDTCDAMWRNRAFYNYSQNSIFRHFGDEESLEVLNLHLKSDVFSLYKHPGLLSLVIKFLQQTQPADNKVHPNQLKEHKEQLLTYFKKHHMNGLVDFFRSTIKRNKSSGANTSSSTDSHRRSVLSAINDKR